MLESSGCESGSYLDNSETQVSGVDSKNWSCLDDCTPLLHAGEFRDHLGWCSFLLATGSLVYSSYWKLSPVLCIIKSFLQSQKLFESKSSCTCGFREWHQSWLSTYFSVAYLESQLLLIVTWFWVSVSVRVCTGTRLWARAHVCLCVCWLEWEYPLPSLICLNVWSQDSRTSWEGLGGMAMLEEVCHHGQVLRFQSMPSLVSSLSTVCLCIKI